MLSSKCTTSLLRTDPTGSMWKWYSGPVILQAVPVPISKQSISPSTEQTTARFTEGFLHACGYFLQSSLFCYDWSECLRETAAVCLPSPPSEAEPHPSPQRESFRKSPLPAAALAPCPHDCPLSSPLCALSHEGCLPRSLPLQCGWCQLLQISGQWYLPSLGGSEEAERYILTVKSVLPPPCELRWLFLFSSHPLHSWWGAILNMPLSLLPLPDWEEKGLGLERKID